MISIPFTITNNIYTYSDCLHLPDDHTFSEDDINKMKQQRFDNWLKIIDSVIEQGHIDG